ncbi:MAG: hypothetical protein N2517_08550 [Ignavibacteria bacterium]|nr:hypothetical protein [Ignavibacteria bacterium]
MDKENYITMEERALLLEALRKIVAEGKEIYDGYLKYFDKQEKRKKKLNQLEEENKEVE